VPRPTVAICRTCPRDTAKPADRGENPDGMAAELRSALLAGPSPHGRESTS